MGIVSAFRKRNPKWAAGLALFSPTFAMLYLGKGRLGLAYFVADALVKGVVPVALAYYRIPQHDLISTVVIIAYRCAAALHAYITASRQPPLERYPWFSRLANLVALLIIVPLLVALVVRNLVVEPFNISSTSMMPTLKLGDYVLSEKITYGISRYSIMRGLGPSIRIGGRLPLRGEVVVFALPSNPNVDYIKRVIGLPGDRIQMRDGRLFINGTMVERQRLETNQTDGSDVIYTERLPGGVDHQIIETSDDSPGDNTAEFLVPDGHYFMMGDNRDNSADSRFDVGYVPADNIKSRPFLVVFNGEDANGWWLSIR